MAIDITGWHWDWAGVAAAVKMPALPRCALGFRLALKFVIRLDIAGMMRREGT